MYNRVKKGDFLVEDNIIIRLQDISKKFEDDVILDSINLSIKDKEFMTFLGPSGCGKTTTLRIIAGFLEADSGQVLFEGKDINLIHHSDRGCQYASREYVNILRNHGIQVSMTETGDPKDNAQAERINNTMKNELLKGKVFRNIEEVITAVALAVDFYNNRRPHMSIGMMTPIEAAKSTGDRHMKWISYRHMAIKNRDNLLIPEITLPLSE